MTIAFSVEQKFIKFYDSEPGAHFIAPMCQAELYKAAWMDETVPV